jgi:CRISPR-associated Csx2 family protein
MARVLISFLGTGSPVKGHEYNYNMAKYRFGESEREYECPFVAAAIAEEYQVDRIVLLGTVRSMWEEVYRYFGERNNCFDEYVWLEIGDWREKNNHTSALEILHEKEISEALKPGSGSRVVPIYYGITAEEIRKNSDIILGLERDVLQRDDEVILDITHAFRSLPMYVMNLLFYLRNVSDKQITISHICYGMMEMSREVGYSPVVELKELLTVNDWIEGAYSFRKYGNGYRIAELVSDKDVKHRLQDFSDAKNLNYLVELENQCQKLQAIKNKELSPIANLVVKPVVSDFLRQVPIPRKDDPHRHSNFQYQLARWQCDNYDYAAAYISLNEAIVTRACEALEQDPVDYDSRERVKEQLRKRGTEQIEALKEYATLGKKVSQKRNAIAHQIRDQKQMGTAGMISALRKFLRQYKEKLL